MATIKRKIASPILNYMLKAKKHIIVSDSSVDYALLKNVNAAGTKEYPVTINGSKIGNIEFGEGCRFFDCVCHGTVRLGRFVTFAGPGVKVCGNVEGISIGSFTSVGANVTIQEGEHNTSKITTYFINRNVIKNRVPEETSKGKIVICEDVWIGSNSTVLSGVTIGRGAVVGAGSVVTRDIPPYAICIGAPAKVMRYRFDATAIEKIEKSKWWEMSTDEMKKFHKLFESENFLTCL